MKRPEPETTRAKLYCESLREFTQHAFVEARPCVLPSPDGAAWEFIFKCEVTGAERRWGTTDRVEAN